MQTKTMKNRSTRGLVAGHNSPKLEVTAEWISKVRYTHKTRQHMGTERNELLVYATLTGEARARPAE